MPSVALWQTAFYGIKILNLWGRVLATAALLLSLAVAAPPAHGAGGSLTLPAGDPQAGKQEAKASVVDRDGNLIVTGYQNLGAGTDDDYLTVKFNANGTVAWRKTYNRSGGSDQATAVAVDSGNNVIVSGFAWNGANYDIHTVKYHPDGTIAWQHTYNAPAGGNDIATAVAVDGLDNVYVAGHVQNGGGNEDYAVIKYSVSGPNPDGTPIWVATWNGSASGVDKAASVSAVSGSVAVTGQSWNGTDFDIFTKVFNADTGAAKKTAGNQDIEWRHANAGADSGRKVLVDGAGNVIVAGAVSNGSNLDIHTVKYSTVDLSVVWQKTYNGTDNFDDEPNALALDNGGNVYVAGYTYTLAGREDLCAVRYNASDGAKAWDKVYDSGSEAGDIGLGLVLDAGGNVYVNGYTVVSGGNNNILTLKLRNDNGSQLWQASFDGAAGKNDKPAGLSLGSGGEVMVGGWSDQWTAGASDYDYYMLIYDPGLLNPPSNLAATVLSNTSVRIDWSDNSANEDGFRIERKLGELGAWSEIGTVAADVATFTDTGLTANSTYYYRVRSYNAANGSSNPSAEVGVLTLYVTYLSPTWSYVFNGADNSDDYPAGIAVGPDNNPVVTGYSFATAGGFDYYTVKLNRGTGAVVWSDRYNDADDELDMGRSVVVDSTSAAVVTGYSSLFYAPAEQNVNSIYTIKYPAAGPPLAWDGQYNGPGGIDDRATSIASAVDGSNSVVVVGYGKNAANNDDIYLVKYAANPSLDGFGKAIPAWSATPYNGGGNDYPSAVAFDKDGNVFITGYRHNGTNYDIFTAKYNGATGAQIWSHYLDTDDFGDDYGKSLAIDAAGNVYVAGSGRNAAGNDDIILVKYDGKTVPTGQRVIWRKTHDGPVHGNDGGVTVNYDLIDDTVVVGGTVLTAAGDRDYIIIRYDSAGTEKWNKTHLRPGTDEEAHRMAMDVSGNVCVAGHTGNGVTTDAMSVKYNYEGTLIAATIYNGAANSFDEATAVTVNSLGETLVTGYTTNASGNADYLVYKGGGQILQASSPFTAAPFYTKVDLTWTDTSTGEEGFHIQRKVGACDSANAWSLIFTAPPDTTTYSDTGLNTGEDYCYRVRAFKGGEPDPRWIERYALLTSPTPPGSVTPTPVNTTRIDLTWQDNTTGETSFRIFRCSGAGCSDYAEIGSSGSNVATYNDTGVTAGTSYSYKILAQKTGDWQSDFSTPASATTPSPSAPTGLAATRVSEGEISLTWSDSNNDETGFRIERCAGAACNSFTQIDTVAANATSYSDIVAVQPDTLYRYQVRAYKTATAGWNGPYSAIAEATATYAAPTLNSATTASTTSVNLAWTDTTGSETGFSVERCTGTTCDDADYASVALTGTSAATATDTSACNATTYTYRIKPVNRGLSLDGNGSWTRRVSLTIANFQPGFQTRFVVPYDADMQPDFDDIRFFDETTQRELPYWIETKNDGASATVWIKTGGFNTVSLYYGNPNAASVGSGKAVFDFFDDFTGTTIDTAKWTAVGGYYSQNNELISSGGPGSWSTGMFSVQNFTRPFVFEASHYRSGGNYMMLGAKNTGAGVSYTDFTFAAYPIYDGGGNRLAVYEDGNNRGDNKKAISSDVWQYFRLDVLPTTGANYYHGTSSATATSFYSSTYSTASPLKVGFPNYSQAFKLDNVRVRKYTAIEPSVTLGTEEVFGGAFTITWTGQPSNTRSATTTTATAPTGLSAARQTEVRINLSWTDTTTDETGFRVYRCAGASCTDFAQVGSDLAANSVAFGDTGLTPGTTYTYKVKAFKSSACGWELESNTASAETTVLAPAGFAGSASVTTGCEDIRVTDSDGTTLISQWVQQLQCNTTGTRIFQKVPSITAGTTKTVYYYYGNIAAPTVDDGDATFEFFDDFNGTAINGSKWSQTLGGAGDFTVQNGTLRGNNSNGRLRSNFNLLTGMLATFKAKTTTLATNPHMIGGVYNGTYDYLGMHVGPGNGGYNLYAEGIIALTTTSVPAHNIGYSIYNTDGVTTTVQAYDWDSGAWYISPAAKSFSINNKPLTLGRAYYWDYYAGQTYQTDWDWVLVRKMASPAPTGTAGTREYGPFTVGGTTFAVRIPITVNHTASGAANLTNYQAVLPLLNTTPLATDRITLTWTDTAGSETGFAIERCTGAGCATTFTVMDTFTAAADTTSYTDRTVAPAETYCYRVKATIPTGDSAYADVVCAATSTPTPPSNLLTAVAGTKVDLTWTDNTSNEDGFQIERCAGLNCDFSSIDAGFPVTVGASATATVTYSDTTACSGTYMYRVKSIKPWVTGWPAGYSDPVAATLSDPVAPSAPAATAASEVRVDLSWTDNTADEAGFKIERCEGTGCSGFAQITTVGANATSYADYGLLPNHTYRYRVRAYKGGGCGWDTPYSAEVEVSTTVPAPGSLTLTAPASTQVNLSWVDTTASETSFRIERCEGAGCSVFGEVGTASANGTAYSDTSVCGGTSYTYQLRAVNEGVGNSGGGCWSRRVPLTFTDFKADFLVKLTVPYDADMQTDFDDLRFIDHGTGVELPYWIESKTDGVSATVWIKTDKTGTAWLYYGNPNAVATSSQTAIFGSGLMAFFPFNEAAGTIGGTTKDVSGTGNDLTMSGFASPYGVVSGGTYGNALSLNGSGQWANRSAPNVPTGSVATVEAWIYPKGYADASYNGIVSWSSRGCNGLGFALSIQNSGRPSMPTWCNDYVPGAGATATLNAWNHVAAVLNGKSATLYVNGQQVGTTTLTYLPSLSSINLAIGVLDYPGRYFNGMIDEVRIYNRALTAQEITSRYATAIPTVALGAEEQAGGCYSSDWLYTGQPSSTASITTPTVAAPTGASATKASESQINLAWTDASSDETNFVIERCSGASCDFSTKDTFETAAGTVSYSDVGLLPDTTYRYRIRAKRTASCTAYSAYSSEVQATTSVTVPGGLTATAASTTRINLAWTDNTGSDTGFKIERCEGSGCGSFSQIGVSATNVPSYSDTTVCPNTSYTYRVRAFNAGLSLDGGGSWTRRAPITIANFQANFQTKVTIPYDSDMKADYSDIRFLDPVTNQELPYWIETKTDGVTATVWVKTRLSSTIYLYYGNAGATSVSSGPLTFEFFDDFTGTTLDAAKWTKVGSYYSQNNELISSGGNDNWDSGVYSVQNFARPFVFEASHYHTGGNHLMLGIKDTGAGISYTDFPHAAYAIYDGTNRLAVYEDGANRGDNKKAISTGAWQYYKFEVLSTGANFYHGASTSAYTAYYNSAYSSESPLKLGFANNNQAFKLDSARVRKYASPEPAATLGAEEQSAGFTFTATYDSGYSATASATTPAPVAPAALTATAVTDTSIDLAWSDLSPDETTFRIERCTGDGCSSFAEIATVAAGTTGYTATGLDPSTTYCFRVRADKSATCTTLWPTDYTNVSCDKSISAHPDTLDAVAVNAFKIRLDWADNASDEEGYEIEVQAWNGKWVKTGQVGADVTTYTDTIGIDPLKTYTYRVRAFRGTDKSPYSNSDSATTPAYNAGDVTCE